MSFCHISVTSLNSSKVMFPFDLGFQVFTTMFNKLPLLLQEHLVISSHSIHKQNPTKLEQTLDSTTSPTSMTSVPLTNCVSIELKQESNHGDEHCGKTGEDVRVNELNNDVLSGLKSKQLALKELTLLTNKLTLQNCREVNYVEVWFCHLVVFPALSCFIFSFVFVLFFIM